VGLIDEHKTEGRKSRVTVPFNQLELRSFIETIEAASAVSLMTVNRFRHRILTAGTTFAVA
jgi:hypothetical protein